MREIESDLISKAYEIDLNMYLNKLTNGVVVSMMENFYEKEDFNALLKKEIGIDR